MTLDELVAQSKPSSKASPKASSSVSSDSTLDELIAASKTSDKPVNPKVQQYQSESVAIAKEAEKANSFGGIVKNTIKGIPKAAVNVGKDVVKGAAEFALSTGEALPRLLGKPFQENEYVAKILPPAEIPGLRFLGPVQSFQSKAAQAVQDGSSVPVAVGKGTFETIINDPVGIAFKPALLAAGAAGKALSRSSLGEKEMSNIIKTGRDKIDDLLQRSKPAEDTFTPIKATDSTAARSPGVEIADAPPTIKGEPIQPVRSTMSGVPETVRPEQVLGTGDVKTRGLSAGVESKAIEKELTTSFGDLPEYQSVSMKDQADRATQILAEDQQLAKNIALGKEPPPNGVLPESVFVAVEKKAIQEGDVETLRQLATGSNLSTEATTMGQRIRTLAERNPDSPVKAISDVVKARAERVQRLGIKDVAKTKKEAVKSIKSTIAKAPKENWDSFISSITC